MNKTEHWIAYFKGIQDKVILEEIKTKNNNIKLLDDIIEKYWAEEKI